MTKIAWTLLLLLTCSAVGAHAALAPQPGAPTATLSLKQGLAALVGASGSGASGAVRDRETELATRTVDQVIPEADSERAHGLQGERTFSGEFNGRRWRDARDGGWFSFELKVSPEQPVLLVCTYWGSDGGGREFDLLVDGKKIATERLESKRPGVFYDQGYPVPAELTKGKERVTVRFQAHPSRMAGGVFGCRILRGHDLLPPPPPAGGLGQRTRTLETRDYRLVLGEGSGVAVQLLPKAGKDFDFLPSDRLAVRSGDGSVHLGDLSLRARPAGAGAWSTYTTYGRRQPVRPVSASETAVTHDLAATLPAACPLGVERSWENAGGRLRLEFRLSNRGVIPIEVGALGLPMPFNNIITGRSLEEAHARCSFTDPYIGEDAGYLRVTQLNGVGPTLVVTPVGKTPLQAWRLVNEPMRPNQTFEGMMEWMVHSRAYAENEWKGALQWNEPTAATLKPGETRTYGVQFSASPSIRAVEATLAKLGRPVAVGLPGYILPMDQTGKLFLKHGSPVKNLAVEPSGALELARNREGKEGWKGYTVKGRQWGRARLTLEYADGTRQVVSYYVTRPSAEAVADLGRFLTTKAWFTDEKDPFRRAPSAISYDREADRQVLQEPRVWIAGLGDEGGSGNWLALAMKAFGQPEKEEVHKLEAFVQRVLWGNLQFKEGPRAYGVRKSVFFYDPRLLPDYPYSPRFDWRSWTSWSKAATDDVGRGYNYPHVVAAYWSLYRIARNHPGLAQERWEWYLEQAYRTTEFLTSRDARGQDRVGYWRLGLMEGTIFVALLDDLKREGWTAKAALVEARMRERADRWKNEPYPFGSEMAWDSTGQEEVYAWCKRFGYEEKAQVTLNSILAYDPTVPHWGYNGNARRYWDFLYGGKLSRIERQLHHYGSGLNAIPLLTEFRQHPEDLYLLRVGYGGAMGPLANIDRDGFASAAFHSFPSTLQWDAYSGDYGPNFFGHALNIGTYVVETKAFGWQAFGGDLRKEAGWVVVRPRDSFRKRVYLAPAGLFLTLDAGAFESVAYQPRTGAVRVTLSPATPETPRARLRWETPVPGQRSYAPEKPLPLDAGAGSVPLGSGVTRLTLLPSSTRATALKPNPWRAVQQALEDLAPVALGSDRPALRPRVGQPVAAGVPEAARRR